MVLIFAKNLTSSFPFCFNIYIFLLLLYLYFNILLLLSYFLYLLYTVNQFSFTHFRYCVSTFSYKHMPQCKFSLYLKKAGLASRNIVHFLKKVILRCIGLCFNYHHNMTSLTLSFSIIYCNQLNTKVSQCYLKC